MRVDIPLPITDALPEQEIRALVQDWIRENVPEHWRDAAIHGGRAALRTVRSAQEYEEWYPHLAASGLVQPTWRRDHGGLGVSALTARVINQELGPLHLAHLNLMGLYTAGPTILAWGSDAQARRFLPPIVRADEIWCQLFSEPGSGSDLASLATRAQRDGDDWVVNGQKVWSTHAHKAHLAMLLARTDERTAKRLGLTYFAIDMRQPGIEVRPLRQMTGDADFNEVFLSDARIPDAWRIGPVGEGWKVARSTLGNERLMTSGPGSGAVDRVGGVSVETLMKIARERSIERINPASRQRLMRLYAEDRIRTWTNARARAAAKAGRAAGPESSIGKVHSTELNQRLQELAMDLLGLEALGWAGEPGAMPHVLKGFLRSRANTIEGGTSEINRTILGERILGLPPEPDPWAGVAWNATPRS